MVAVEQPSGDGDVQELPDSDQAALDRIRGAVIVVSEEPSRAHEHQLAHRAGNDNGCVLGKAAQVGFVGYEIIIR